MSSDHIFTAIPYEGFDNLLGGSSGSSSGGPSWRERCGDWFRHCSCSLPSIYCNLPSCDCSCSLPSCEMTQDRKQQCQIALRWLLVFGVALLAGVGLGAILGELIHLIRAHHHQHKSNAQFLGPADVWEEHPFHHIPRASRHGGFWKKSPPRIRHHSRPDRHLEDDFFPLQDEIVVQNRVDDFFPLELVDDDNMQEQYLGVPEEEITVHRN